MNSRLYWKTQMRRILLFVFLLVFSQKSTFVTNARNHGYKIVCYYSTWAVYRPAPMSYGINNIPGNLCTHLVYQYVGLDEKTNGLKSLDKYFDYELRGLIDFAALRLKWPHLKIMVSVGGWADSGVKYSNMVSKSESRRQFISSVLSFLNHYKFDGLDLDWQYPGVPWRGGEPSDITNLSHLLKVSALLIPTFRFQRIFFHLIVIDQQELKEEFVKRNYILSVIVPIVESYVKSGYDVDEISRHLDQIHVMAFHLRSNWTGFADIHSPLYPRSFDTFDRTLNVRDGLKMWVDAGAPKNKLIVGVPFFGKSFTLKNPKKNTQKSPITQPGLGVAGNYSHEPGFLTYYEQKSFINYKLPFDLQICTQIESGKWTRKWDAQGKAPYAFHKDQWVGYEDDESLAEKMKFIKSEGYGGAMIWSIG
uniref:Chitinase 8 n=1 Tax=Tetranychus cinnabarinus TaxID=93129 RepID=A0A2H4QGS4_TETCI|nr:chitinase 8 [Tetranychus cinnabarinus]